MGDADTSEFLTPQHLLPPTGFIFKSIDADADGSHAVATLSVLPGDFNRDGHVDASDIQAMEAALVDLNGYQSSKSLNDEQMLALSDLNGDGQITNADLQWPLNSLKSGGGSAKPVPESPSLTLLALGAIGLSWFGMRSKCPGSERTCNDDHSIDYRLDSIKGGTSAQLPTSAEVLAISTS